MAADITAQYLFSNTQKRSFDLQNKPWSRYIELYENLAQAEEAFGFDMNMLQRIYFASPGINTLTRDVKVDPGFNISSNFSLIYEPYSSKNGFNVEAGYNFYARESECLKLKNKCTLNAAIKDHVGRGLTNAVRDMTGDKLINEARLCSNILEPLDTLPNNVIETIRTNFNDGKLLTDNLDLSSAAHPCVLSHTLYGSIGYQWVTACFPLNGSIGGSYEFSGNNNAAMDRWLVWGKLGVSF